MENQNARYLYEALSRIAKGQYQDDLDLAVLSPPFQEVGEAINYIGQCLKEVNEFALHLAAGNLDAPVPSRSNYLGGGMKELHATLSHLTWQAQQVTKGDYSQRVNFMGEFSQAFNTMIVRLEERENQLKQEIDKNVQRAKATQESNKLLLAIMDGIEDWLVVTDAQTGQMLFSNRVARESLIDKKFDLAVEYMPLFNQLQNYHETDAKEYWEFTRPKSKRIFAIHSYSLQWSGRQAYAHLIQDITFRREKDQEMIRLAYQDTLTGVYNRRYGEQQLRQLLEEKQSFCLCYVDLDGLKYVNDHFGHPEGDDYICQVAQALCRFSRSSDFVCRMGGDEFMTILIGCNVENGKERMKRVRDYLMEQSQGQQKPYAFSISYGLVDTMDETHAITPSGMLKEADEKMYALKRQQNKKRRE